MGGIKAASASASARLLYVLSPAKTLDMSPSSVQLCSMPSMLSDAHELVGTLRKLPKSKLKSLLGVSDALATLNYDRYQNFELVTDAKALAMLQPNAVHKQAALALHGPAYQGLAASELSPHELAYAQSHLRILCGLYGMLRPLDLMQAYRLEMSSKLQVPNTYTNTEGKPAEDHRDLYAFWGDRLAHAVNGFFHSEAQKDGRVQATSQVQEKVLVNVASQEYFKAIPRSALDSDIRVVECVFKDDGRIKSVYAKRARGLMCRYLITNEVASVEGIKGFDLEGYGFHARESTDDVLVFHRSAAAQKKAFAMQKAHAGGASVKAPRQQGVKQTKPVKKKEENKQTMEAIVDDYELHQEEEDTTARRTRSSSLGKRRRLQ